MVMVSSIPIKLNNLLHIYIYIYIYIGFQLLQAIMYFTTNNNTLQNIIASSNYTNDLRTFILFQVFLSITNSF